MMPAEGCVRFRDEPLRKTESEGKEERDMKNHGNQLNKWWIGGLCVLVMTLLCTAALADVAINEANFPDPVFRAYVAENYDTNAPKGTLTSDEIDEAKRLYLNEKGISSLKGVEYLTNLQYLESRGNSLKSLDVSKNLSLFSLNCSENQLTSLDLSKNDELEFLNCAENRITSLDVSHCESLVTFYCDYNGMKSLNLGTKEQLELLSCSYNELTSLNLKPSKSLKNLVCYENQISSLDVTGFPQLVELYCSHNPLKSVDVSKCSKLREFFCYENQLTALDVTHNPELEILTCQQNKIASLNLSNNKALHYLTCDDNSLTELNISACTALNKLVLGEKPVFNSGDEYLDFGDVHHIYSVGMRIGKKVRITTSEGLYTRVFLHNTILNFTRTKKDPNPTFKMEADYLPAGKSMKLKWTSSNPKVVRVDKNGKIKVLKAGKATITCTAQDGYGTKDTCVIKIKDTKITKITLNKTKAKLKVGATLQLKAKIKPSSAVNQKLKWTSSNKKVAKVDKNGKVLAVKKGTCVIVCTATDGSKKKASCKITVR